ncbi:unnamed protein product [Effrenium voratum]|nr:unnamed protein product [Effrenium voratum]
MTFRNTAPCYVIKVFHLCSSLIEGDSPRPWPKGNSVKEFRSKVKGTTVQIAGQARSNDAGFGVHPEKRILALQAKLEEAHGSLSGAFAAMDLHERGYVSFGDFHSHLARSSGAREVSSVGGRFRTLDDGVAKSPSDKYCALVDRGGSQPEYRGNLFNEHSKREEYFVLRGGVLRARGSDQEQAAMYIAAAKTSVALLANNRLQRSGAGCLMSRS